MKKLFGVFTLVLCLTAALSTQVLATDETSHTWGMTVDMNSGYTLTPDGTSATSESNGTVYGTEDAKVEQISLTFTATADTQYMVFLLDGDDGVPTATNLRYINQVAGESGKEVTFTIYPDNISTAGTYTIYVSSSAGYVEAGSVTVIESWTEAEYVLGDVDSLNGITATDANWILQYLANLKDLTSTQQSAANVNGKDGITATDANLILQYLANLISELS